MYKRFSLLILSFLVFTGCASTISEKIYLQEVQVNGPINHPPINITQKKDNSTFTISPKISINTTRNISGRIRHSNVDAFGNYQIDTVRDGEIVHGYKESSLNVYQYKGKNLHWTLPDIYTGVDVDIALSKSVSFNGSLNFSNQMQKNLMGGSAGLGFSSEQEKGAIRFDIGLGIQEYAYDAETVVITTYKPIFGSESTDVLFYHDINKSSNLNLYGSLLFNSTYNSVINFFLGLSYFSQTLLDFEPKENNPEYSIFGQTKYTTDLRGEASTSYFSLTPGLYYNVSENSRLVAGFSLIKDMGIEANSESLILLPVIKYDLMF